MHQIPPPRGAFQIHSEIKKPPHGFQIWLSYLDFD
jgi:hypothetical protein